MHPCIHCKRPTRTTKPSGCTDDLRLRETVANSDSERVSYQFTEFRRTGRSRFRRRQTFFLPMSRIPKRVSIAGWLARVLITQLLISFNQAKFRRKSFCVVL